MLASLPYGLAASWSGPGPGLGPRICKLQRRGNQHLSDPSHTSCLQQAILTHNNTFQRFAQDSFTAYARLNDNMAVAPHRASFFQRLPAELRLAVFEQPCLSVRDLISLARTSRSHYDITIFAAYKAHIKNEFGFASKCCCARSTLLTRHDPGMVSCESKLTVCRKSTGPSKTDAAIH